MSGSSDQILVPDSDLGKNLTQPPQPQSSLEHETNDLSAGLGSALQIT